MNIVLISYNNFTFTLGTEATKCSITMIDDNDRSIALSGSIVQLVCVVLVVTQFFCIKETYSFKHIRNIVFNNNSIRQQRNTHTHIYIYALCSIITVYDNNATHLCV